jgi:hypothetical protein
MENKGIAYFASGLGNFILMMPALQAMKNLSGKPIDVCFPNSWNDSRRNLVADICGHWPTIDRIIKWPKDAIDPNRYRYWFYSAHAGGSDATNLFRRNRRYSVVAGPPWRGTQVHEADHYREIAHAIGCVGPMPRIEFPFDDGPDLSDLKRPIVGLCNGAFTASYWLKKHWPHFRTLAHVLKNYLDCSVVGIGGKKEMDGVPLDRDFCGKIPIRQSARAISQCDVFVATDTGCMHLADAIGTKVVALFGPTLPSKVAPRGKRAKILVSGFPCVPCQYQAKFYTCKTAQCMSTIKPGDVVAAIKETIYGTRKSYES